MKQKGITAEDLRARKLALKKEIATVGGRIKQHGHNLVSPAMESTSRAGRLGGMVATAIALYDGVKMGMTVMRGLRAVLKK